MDLGGEFGRWVGEKQFNVQMVFLLNSTIISATIDTDKSIERNNPKNEVVK